MMLIVANGRAVLLIGPSSSGKTTAAKNLQSQLWPDVWLHYAVDDFWKGFLAGHRPEAGAFMSFYSGVYRAVASFAHADLNVILEAVISHAHLIPLVRDAFEGINTTVVGFRCAPEILDAREVERGDRTHGLARGQHDRLHALWSYDVEVDTALTSPAEVAEAIAVHVRAGTASNALARTAASVAAG